MIKHTLKSRAVRSARFLRYVWSFFNTMHERVDVKVFCIISLWKEPKVSKVNHNFESFIFVDSVAITTCESLLEKVMVC